MKKIIKTIFITSLILLMSSTVFLTSIFGADSQECQNLERQYSVLMQQEFSRCNVSSSTYDEEICNNIRSEMERVNSKACGLGCDWADCGPACNPPFYYDKMGNQYRVDNSPYIVWKIIRKGSNEIMFCIEPEQAMNECADYTTTPATLDAETFTKISLAAMFFNEEPSNEHYVAAQLYVWEVMGSPRTVNGQGINYYWNGLVEKIEEALTGALPDEGEGGEDEPEIVEKEVVKVEFEQDNIMTDLNGEITNHDMNDALTNEFFELTIDPMGSDGQDGNVQENAEIDDGSHSVVGETKNIWPSTKTYTVEPIVESTTEITGEEGGGLTGLGSFLMADYSQNLYSFDGALENGTTLATITVYEGDEYTTQLRTGDLSFTKIEEWSQNAGAGHVYRIWYAKQDPNGTAIDDAGTRWSKYEPFVSEPDWNGGQTQSTYTTDANGKFMATGLPSGGHWNDGTPIGTYIIQEVDTTNPYQLNGKQYVFTIGYNQTTSLTVMNHERIVDLVIDKYDIEESNGDHHMNEDDLLLNGAEYSVWDISDSHGSVLEDVFGEDEKRYQTNYFIKLGKSADLSVLLADEIAKVTAAHDGIVPRIDPSEHCESFTFDQETNTLTAHKIDTVDVYFINPEKDYDIWGSYKVYITTDDDTLCAGDTCEITGFRQFRGVTGKDFVQLVDVQNHHLPKAYEYLTVYYDEACTKPYGRYQADEFGMIDFTTSYFEPDPNVEENYDGDDLYYYQLIQEYHEENEFFGDAKHPALGDSLEGYHHSEAGHATNTQVGYNSGYTNLVTYEITGRELEHGKDAEKGRLTIPNLHHSRTYLICESGKPENYDLVDDNAYEHNACFIYNTDEVKYPEFDRTELINKYNKKVRGDLELQKLNEWYDPDKNNVEFELYHAALRKWSDVTDEEGQHNEMLDDRNDWDLNYGNVIYCERGYTYDRDKNVCIFDGHSDYSDNDGKAEHEPQFEASKENYPVLGDPVINPDTGTNIFIADDEGKIVLSNKLHYGWYILVEHDEKNPYVENKDYVLFYIGHDVIEGIHFTNENRTVTFEVFKEDLDSGIKINGAGYTVWDISDTLDSDMFPTDTGEDGDMEGVDWGETSSIYGIDKINFGVKLTDVDLYYLFIEGTPFEDQIANRPIHYELSDYTNAYVSEDGIFHGEHPNYITVDVYGGARSLYGTAGNITVYQGEVFDPYADLEFYGDAAGTDHIKVDHISYSTESGSIFNTDALGTYTLTYTLTTDEHITYRFDRKITVIEDNRHYCKYDVDSDSYIWNDTKEPCAVIDLSPEVEKAKQPIVLLYSDSDYDPSWNDKYIFSFNLFVTLDDGELISDINAATSENIPIDANAYSIDGVKVFEGMTGHKYIQTVDPDNHNLPLPNSEVVIYYDKEMRYPFRLYTSDENGMVDLNEDEFTQLAPYPEIHTTPDGRKYIISAQKTEYVDEVSGDILGHRWETVYIYLNDTVDEGLEMVDNIEYVYWLDPVSETVKEISMTQQDGRLEINNLKHDRDYLVCETTLPEGYTYSEVQDACFVLDTSETNYGYDDFGDKITNFNGLLVGGTRYNELRHIDVAVYKYNENKTIKLDGAIFDVYDILNEGEDGNTIDNSIADMPLYTAEDGTQYLKPALGATDKKCADPHYIYDNEAGACVIAPSYIYTNTGVAITDWKSALGYGDNFKVELVTDPSTILFDQAGEYRVNFKVTETITTELPEYPEGHEPEDFDPSIYPIIEEKVSEISRTLVVTDEEIKDTVEYSELGTCNSYISSETPRSAMIALDEYGNYLKDGEGGACYIKYEEATVKRTYLGRYVSGGIYIQDANARYVEVATDEAMTNIVKRVYLDDDGVAKIMGLSDGIYYTQLSNSNDVIQHYVAKGMIYLPYIPYGHTLLVEEIEAPDGYWFDENDQYRIIEPTAEYGIHRIEAERFNKAVIIPQLDVQIEDVLNKEAYESIFTRKNKFVDPFGLID